MPLQVRYPHNPASGAPRGLTVAAVRAVAAQVRTQLSKDASGHALDAGALVGLANAVDANGRIVGVTWDFAHEVHDDAGMAVLGVCQTDPTAPGMAYISINATMVAACPVLAVSTAAHELGHVIFDVPAAMLAPSRCYRTVTACPAALNATSRAAERRANEFMGALLAPPVPLHTRLLAMAREERLRLTRAEHQGRPGSPVLAGDNQAEAIEGVIAALAGEFGVTDRFIAVRLRCYGLIAGGVR